MISHVVDCPIASRRIVAMHGDDVLISPNSGPISLANNGGDIRAFPSDGGLTTDIAVEPLIFFEKRSKDPRLDAVG